MPEELLAGVPTYRWLYTIALALGGTALLIALTSRLGRFGRLNRLGLRPQASIALAVGALVALLYAAVATVERLPFGFERFDGVDYARDLGFGAMYILALLIGATVALGSVLTSRWLAHRLGGRYGLLLPAIVPPVVLIAATIGLVAVVRDLRAAGHFHPPGTRAGPEVEADRLATASFATDLVVASTGEIYVAEHLTGNINVLVPDEGGGYASQLLTTLPIPSDGRLLHLALHPQWPQQPYLYASAHQGSGPEQRLAVFRLQIDRRAVTAVDPVIEGLPTEDPTRGAEADHFGSALATCGGYLYLSVGDTDSPGPDVPRPGNIRERAQMPGRAEGKVLRYRFEGPDLVPAVPNDATPPVFALGFRNPFSMDCGADPERVIVADNGFVGYDQVREVTLDSNHEWPLSDERDALTPPLFDSGPTSWLAPTGVAFETIEAKTAIWFSTFHTGSIYRLILDDSGAKADHVELTYEAGEPILSLADGPDGCLYFSTSTSIWRIRDGACAALTTASATGTATAAGGRVDNFEPATFFRTECAPCHGFDRAGGVAPSLLPELLSRPDDYYIQRILQGVPGTLMPSWGEAGLSEDQAKAMVDFLRTEP